MWLGIFLELGLQEEEENRKDDCHETLRSATGICKDLQGVAEVACFEFIMAHIHKEDRLDSFVDSGAAEHVRRLSIKWDLLPKLSTASLAAPHDSMAGIISVPPHLRTLCIVYDSPISQDKLKDAQHALFQACCDYGKTLRTLDLVGVPMDAEKLSTAVHGKNLVSLRISLGNIPTGHPRSATHYWPTEILRFEKGCLPQLRHLTFDERHRDYVSTPVTFPVCPFSERKRTPHHRTPVTKARSRKRRCWTTGRKPSLCYRHSFGGPPHGR